jgi:K+ transporter
VHASTNNRSTDQLVTASIGLLESGLQQLRDAAWFALFLARLLIYVMFRIEIPSPQIAKSDSQDEANLATVIAAMKLHHR